MRQPCPFINIQGDDGVTYQLPVKEGSRCSAEVTQDAAGGAIAANTTRQRYAFQAAVPTISVAHITELPCRSEAYVWTTFKYFFGRLLTIPTEIGALLQNVEILYNNDEKPLLEGVLTCYLWCFFCAPSPSAGTNAVVAEDALLAAGHPESELEGNLLSRPITVTDQDDLTVQSTNPIAYTPRTPLNNVSQFEGMTVGKDCLPPQVTIPEPTAVPCSDAASQPTYPLPVRTL